ncbi:MAG: hypothetical protein WC648_00440 [Candidatus Paceibacterota bacterium]|jgi:hypothetical protein
MEKGQKMFDNNHKILSDNSFVNITGLSTQVATDGPEGFVKAYIRPESSWMGKWTIIRVFNRNYIVLVTDTGQIWIRPKFENEDISEIEYLLCEICLCGYDENMVERYFDKFFSGYPGHPVMNVSGVFERLVDPYWSELTVNTKSSAQIEKEVAVWRYNNSGMEQWPRIWMM